MSKDGYMRNVRVNYEEAKSYASNGLSRLSAEERRETLPWAYGLIEEIQKTYSKRNGNGSSKLNGSFEAKLDELRVQGIDQAKKLSIIAISDESPIVRKIAVVLLLGLATKIANSEKNPTVEEVQLAHDIFNFVISYMKDEENIARMVQEDTSLLFFIIKKNDAYRSVILKLALYIQPKERVSVEDWNSMIISLLPGSVLTLTSGYGE